VTGRHCLRPPPTPCTSRIKELQRGPGLISPAILSRRLDALIGHGLAVKKKIPGQRGHDYFPTESCRELLPVIRSLGDWGMRWARANLGENDYDVELLMLYLKRSIVPETLASIWMGEGSYRQAVRDGSLKLIGHSALTRTITDWMSNSLFAGLPAASEI